MGRFIWNEWARFVSISASVYLVWAAIWGILYRKFFFDFIDHGYSTAGPVPIPIPNPRYQPILEVIVTIPLVQIFALIFAIFTLSFELPAPFMKGTPFERNFTFKAVVLLFQATLAILFYQGTNASIWSTIAAFAYIRAVTLGEISSEPKAARASRGDATARA